MPRSRNNLNRIDGMNNMPHLNRRAKVDNAYRSHVKSWRYCVGVGKNIDDTLVYDGPALRG
jgi:hypothetical protein